MLKGYIAKNSIFHTVNISLICQCTTINTYKLSLWQFPETEFSQGLPFANRFK